MIGTLLSYTHILKVITHLILRLCNTFGYTFIMVSYVQNMTQGYRVGCTRWRLVLRTQYRFIDICVPVVERRDSSDFMMGLGVQTSYYMYIDIFETDMVH
jgi:hypothetical protein